EEVEGVVEEQEVEEELCNRLLASLSMVLVGSAKLFKHHAKPQKKGTFATQ
ncbi:hypothetical protein MKW92_040430, partial [Papaver armeniacum]